MFRTRTEVWQSLKDSFLTALVFVGAGVTVTGILIGSAYLHCLLH